MDDEHRHGWRDMRLGRDCYVRHAYGLGDWHGRGGWHECSWLWTWSMECEILAWTRVWGLNIDIVQKHWT